MKNSIVALALVAIVFMVQSCRKISGDGPVVSKTYSLGTFSAVEASLECDVYYTQGNRTNVEILAQQNILDLIETPIVDGELKIRFRNYRSVWRHDRITVYITTPTIAGLGINGSGNLWAESIESPALSLWVNGSGKVRVSNYTGQRLDADISGSGEILVNGGNVTNEDLQISGSGTIDLLNVLARTASTNTSGSGNTTVRVSDQLNVRISGSGDVYYAGNPSVNTNISGSGKVQHI